MNLVNEADKPVVKRTIVVYSGRFQPFHRGHYDAYMRLVSKFGKNNVYIGTSNVTDNSKSPFNFRDKKLIATKMFAIASDRFVRLSNPYAPEEILNKYDGKTTQYIAAVGGKDADRLSGQYFKPYKGKAGYGYDEIGYVYTIPPEEDPISGTEVRKGLGGKDKEKAKKFFLRAYPKFDKEIFDLITGKLKKIVSEYGTLRGSGQAGSFNNYKADIEREKKDIEEDGMPGGIGVGLVLPGGYINGAPTGSTNETVNTLPSSKMRPEPHPTRHETEHPSDEPDWYKREDPYTEPQNELYDPISQIVANIITESDFEQFVESYFAEKKRNPILDKDITYTNTKGKKKKIKVKDALHLPKDHPAHKQAKDMMGDEPIPTPKSKKKDGESGKASQKAEKPKEGGKEKVPEKEPTGKLKGDDFKTSAEDNKKEQKSGNIVDRIKSKVKEWSGKEKEFFKKHVHKEGSPERRSWGKAIMDKAKGAGHAILHGLKHEWEEFKTAGHAVKQLMTGKKLESHHKKALKSVGIKVVVTALFGAVGGGLAHGLAGFGKHVAMELIPHAVGEVMVKGVGKAAVFAEVAEKEINDATALNIFVAAVAERMQNMKITPEMMEKMIDSYNKKKTDKKLVNKYHIEEPETEHYVPSTGMFSRKLTPQQKIDKLNPARAKEKSRIWHQTFAHHDPDTGETEDEKELKEGDGKLQNINDFVKYATEKLKLKETPKVTLVDTNEYGINKSSLGGYDPESKQIYVQSKGRLSADIIRTIAHEMVHRKQDELGLIRSIEEDGSTGSPIENQANAVAGILLRNYGKRNKKIYTEILDKEDISVKVDKGDTILTGRFKNKKTKVKNIGKDDHGMPTINGRQATTFRTLNEVSALSGGDDQPNGAWLPKNSIRELGSNDGVNKKENWFTNGGYTQTDFPVADAIFGDEDALETYIKYKDDNVPRTDFEKTKFNKAEDKITMNEYQKLAQEVLKELFIDEVSNVSGNAGDAFRTPYLPDWEGFDMNGQNYANIIGYEMLGHDSQHHIQKTKGSVLPVNNPSEENGPGKRTIHPSKGEEYANQKKMSWEMYPFNNREYTFGEPDVYSKPIKNVVKGLNEGVLNEGGAYGHMSHPFDDMDLTFGDLKNIIKGALEGDLGIVREKTDGQALAISWKNGRLIAARNKGHLANAGANAMGISDVSSKFGGRGSLSDAYNFAMNDLSAAISSLSKKQKEKVFDEGKCFMNLEVIWPDNANVIPYGQALLVFHNLVCYDEDGNAVGSDQSAARMLAGMIKQVNADVQSKYTIQGPPITEIPKNQNLSSKQGQYISKLSRLQNQFRCSDSDTVAVYHQKWWENFIDKNAPVKVDKLTKEALVRRWAFGDKSFRLNTISNLTIQNWAIKNDKTNVEKQQKENMKPFEEIFLGVGADVLQFMSSVLTVHPDKAIRSMKDEFKSVANQVRNANNPSLINKLKQEMSRLNSLGGMKSIVPIEGIVFFYNGKTYKLTGSFAALNQILGLLKFSR